MYRLRIDELLKERQKTILWLMVKLPCTESYARRLVSSDIRKLDFATIEQLCAIFDCSIDQLFRKV